MECKRDKGFTLVELLISMTILATVVSLVFSAFRVSVRAWEKGERHIDVHQRMRIVLKLIKRQLTSIYTLPLVNQGNKPFILVGNNKQLTFLSRMPLVPHNRFGIIMVHYRVTSSSNAQNRLDLYEYNGILSNEDIPDPSVDPSGGYLLLTEMTDISFEYLREKSVEQGLVWEPEWNSQEEKGYPQAVKIRVRQNDFTFPLHVISQIQKQFIP